MDLPLFFNGLTKPRSMWAAAAIRPALVAAAAIAGYATFTLLMDGKAPGTTANEQPEWVGQFERPVVEAAQPSAPATSASYVLPEAISTGSLSKKSSTLPAATPKVVSKTVLPPRRPEDANKLAAAPSNPTAPLAIADPAAPTPPGLIPAEAAAPAPHAQNLLSKVTDRLPEKAVLLRPLHLVGDAVHNLIKFF